MSGPLLDERRRRIFSIALPIIGGMVSQNVLNLVDTAMVGGLGDEALAAVGLGSFANFMSMAFITGMSAGVQAMSARRKGEGRESETAVPLNGGLLVAVLLAVPLSLLLIQAAPILFPLLIGDEAVQRLGVPYLQVRLAGMAFVGSNFAFRGYWNAVDLSRLYLRTILVMHATNILFNALLIYGLLGFPELGSTGAGVASTIATGVGTLTYFILGFRHARPNGFLRGLPDLATLKTMLKLAVPAGVQQLFFAAGFTALFWIVGKIGTPEVAAANVLINVTMVAILPGIGLGIAAGSLVGQALGRGDPVDAKRWGWEVVGVGALLMGLLGLPMVLLPDLVLAPFLHDANTLELARLPLQISGLTLVVDAMGLVLLNALMGAGAVRSTLAVSLGMQWGVGLPMAFLLGPTLGFGLVGAWASQVFYRVVQAGIFGVLWQRGSWASIKL